MKIETAAVHAGEKLGCFGGALTLPVFQSSTYLYGGESTYEALRYIRLNNTPNHLALHEKLAALEGGEAGLVTGSGMAAISATLLSLLSAGDHILAQSCLYGATRDLVTRDFAKLGIDGDLVDAGNAASWAGKLRPNTRVFLVEAISNPLVRVGDLPGIVDFCRKHGLVSVIDNTFATPVNFRPLEHGFDLVVHSATKYLNGHSDIVAGAVVGSAERVAEVNRKLLHLGGTLDPHACFLLQRGMRTLALRVRHQNESALQIAQFLSGHPSVLRVHYPGLEEAGSSPAGLALMSGFGGMLSFVLRGGPEAVTRFISRLRFPVEAPSLGGTESLVTRPATTSHSGWTRELRLAEGIPDELIRMSVGIEAVEDLIGDLEEALGQDS